MTAMPREIDARSGWGLGIGIERHGRGRDLWHWGSSPGAKSIMILCPETGDGVVVLTNGSEGSAPMRSIAAKVIGREGCWRPGCES
jgi:Beta-lactamase